MPDKIQSNVGSKKWHQKWWGISFLVVFTLAIVFLGSYLYLVVSYVESNTQQSWQSSDIAQQLDQSGVNPRLMIESNDDPFWGAKDAKIVIVEFGDFQCPFCAQSYTILKSLRQTYPNEVKFIYRDMPDVKKHQLALDSAIAANCAKEQERFWDYHDELFENQEIMTATRLKTIAGNLGLDQKQFDACLDSRKYESEVTNDLAEGISLDVTSTPTFFINGHKVPGVIPYQTLIQFIEEVQELSL